MPDFKVTLNNRDRSRRFAFADAVHEAYELGEELNGKQDFHIQVMRFLVPQEQWALDMELKSSMDNQVIAHRGKPDPKTGWVRDSVWMYTEGSGYSGDDRVGTSFLVTYVREGRTDLRIDEEFYVKRTEYGDKSVRYSPEKICTMMRIDDDGEPYDEEESYEGVGQFDYETFQEALADIQVESLVDLSYGYDWQGEEL